MSKKKLNSKKNNNRKENYFKNLKLKIQIYETIIMELEAENKTLREQLNYDPLCP